MIVDVCTALPLSWLSAIASGLSPACSRRHDSSHGGSFLPGGGNGLANCHAACGEQQKKAKAKCRAVCVQCLAGGVRRNGDGGNARQLTMLGAQLEDCDDARLCDCLSRRAVQQPRSSKRPAHHVARRQRHVVQCCQSGPVPTGTVTINKCYSCSHVTIARMLLLLAFGYSCTVAHVARPTKRLPFALCGKPASSPASSATRLKVLAPRASQSAWHCSRRSSTRTNSRIIRTGLNSCCLFLNLIFEFGFQIEFTFKFLLKLNVSLFFFDCSLGNATRSTLMARPFRRRRTRCGAR